MLTVEKVELTSHCIGQHILQECFENPLFVFNQNCLQTLGTFEGSAVYMDCSRIHWKTFNLLIAL